MRALKRAERALRDALYRGDLVAAEAVGETVDLEAREDATTALHEVVGMGNVEACRWLLDRGANLEARIDEELEDGSTGSRHGATPLVVAAEGFGPASAHLEVLELLIERGADIFARDAGGRTALHAAVEHPDRVETLLRAGLEVDARDRDGVTALMLAHAQGHRAAAEALRASGASEKGIENVDLIDLAAEGFLEGVERCLEAGADPSFRLDRTPLSAAANGGHLEVVVRLIDAGADVNRLESEGQSGDFGPLSRAVYAGHVDIARCLLDAGADPTAKNHGITVLQYAKLGQKERRRPEAPWDALIALIREAVQNVSSRPGSSGAGLVRLRKRSSAAAQSLVEALDLSASVELSEAKALGATLLESQVMESEAALGAWRNLWGPARAEGWSCFLVEDVRRFEEVEPTRAELLEDRAHYDEDVLQDWLDERLGQYEEEDFDDEDEDLDDGPRLSDMTEEDLESFRKRWVTSAAASSPFPSVRSKRPSYRMSLIKGPPGLGLIFYRFGGWNDCPGPSRQAQMVDHWHHEFGVELMVVGRDTLRLNVPRALTLAEAKATAREALAFCSELETVEEAFRALAGTEWSFWWD